MIKLIMIVVMLLVAVPALANSRTHFVNGQSCTCYDNGLSVSCYGSGC